MGTRCKFACVSRREYRNWDRAKPNLFEYSFEAVTGDSAENKAFFAATPQGELKVSTCRVDSFVVGKEYFLDLTPSEPRA